MIVLTTMLWILSKTLEIMIKMFEIMIKMFKILNKNDRDFYLNVGYFSFLTNIRHFDRAFEILTNILDSNVRDFVQIEIFCLK